MKVALLRQVGSTTLDVVDGAETVGVVAGEVKLRIGATGVCHTDMSAMTGVLPTAVPVVLGHEGAGEVIEVGPGVAGLDEGDHVVVAWVPPCGVCARCLGGQANVCLQRDPRPMIEPRFTIGDEQAFAFVGCGTMAEEIVVPANSVVKIAPDVPWDIASLLGCGVMTGVGAALNAAKVVPGSSVAVFGCGGVGASVIQGARIAGAAEIVAIDPLESKREAMRRFGASHAVSPDELVELSRELTGGEGFDFVFEAVGKAAIIRAAYDATRRGGTTCVVGAGSMDDKLELNAMELFAMDKSIVGTLYGSGDVRRDFPMLLRLWRTGRLDLEGMITQRLGLGDVNQALQDMLDGSVIRTVLEMDAA